VSRAWAIPALLVLGSCSERLATAEQCQVIFDRIVENELREKGIRDAELVRRKREALRASYAGELRRCVGRRLPKGAMSCVRRSHSNEEISHQCLTLLGRRALDTATPPQ
jgi:hypothetical protein